MLDDLQFPAFKTNIVNFIKTVTTDQQVISLFESLSESVRYTDKYHIRKIIENNNPYIKTRPSSDATRENPDVKARYVDNKIVGTKDMETSSTAEERSDYPEITPTARLNFICDKCGKPFQNQDDLYHHQKFEG